MVRKSYERYAEDGLVIIGVSFDRDADTARKYAQQNNMPWRHIWVDGADKSELAKLYGVGGIPATFLIGPDGQVVAKDLRGAKLLKAIGEEVEKLKEVRKHAAAERDDDVP